MLYIVFVPRLITELAEPVSMKLCTGIEGELNVCTVNVFSTFDKCDYGTLRTLTNIRISKYDIGSLVCGRSPQRLSLIQLNLTQVEGGPKMCTIV